MMGFEKKVMDDGHLQKFIGAVSPLGIEAAEKFQWVLSLITCLAQVPCSLASVQRSTEINKIED